MTKINILAIIVVILLGITTAIGIQRFRLKHYKPIKESPPSAQETCNHYQQKYTYYATTLNQQRASGFSAPVLERKIRELRWKIALLNSLIDPTRPEILHDTDH